MVRLNGGIALNTNSGGNGSNRRKSGFLSKNLSFWGLVGAAMLLLKLKEERDQYQPVPSEPGSQANPLAPPPYRDDDCDRESAIVLDTTIDRPKRKRSLFKGCCVCCGFNCGRFCLALGIVILGYLAWSLVKLTWWAVTPAPSGLENMPEFSTSLGCLDASHFFTDSKAQATLDHNAILYTTAVDSDGSFELRINGGAVGTITLSPSQNTEYDNTTIALHTTIRSNEEGLLSKVQVDHSKNGNSAINVVTPLGADNEDACMRYDLNLQLPQSLSYLRVVSQSVAQIKFSDEFTTEFNGLETVKIMLSSRSSSNMVLPISDFIAENMEVSLKGGYLSGALSIVGSTYVSTQSGDAISNVKFVTVESDSREAKLSTKTGTGQSTFTYENPELKRVQSEHIVSGQGDLRIDYKQARFNGTVDVKARSYSMSGVRSDMDSGLRYVGDKNGKDSLKVVTDGWVNISF